jgi:FkbM family methyltransferase
MGLRNKINGLREIWKFDNRWQLVSNRIFFPRESISIYRYRGLEFLNDRSAGDSNGARAVLTMPMYRQFLGDLVFDSPINLLDIGANNGGFPLLLKTAGIAIKKYAGIELNPNTFVRLRFNVEKNLGCEISLSNAAVCGDNCTIETTLGDGSTGDSIYADAEASGTKISVEGITFDEACSRHFGEEPIDLCKIDVEGAEFEIFASKHFRSIGNCKFLLMEIHQDGEKRRESVTGVLRQIGFQEIRRESERGGSEHLVHLFKKMG